MEKVMVVEEGGEGGEDVISSNPTEALQQVPWTPASTKIQESEKTAFAFIRL